MGPDEGPVVEVKSEMVYEKWEDNKVAKEVYPVSKKSVLLCVLLLEVNSGRRGV